MLRVICGLCKPSDCQKFFFFAAFQFVSFWFVLFSLVVIHIWIHHRLVGCLFGKVIILMKLIWCTYVCQFRCFGQAINLPVGKILWNVWTPIDEEKLISRSILGNWQNYLYSKSIQKDEDTWAQAESDSRCRISVIRWNYHKRLPVRWWHWNISIVYN